MPSEAPSSDHVLDDDAVLALLHAANWECFLDKDTYEWHVKPPVQEFMGYACFLNLQDVAEYFLMYRRLHEK